MKASRNDPCPCGSGKKYKACCMDRDRADERAARLLGPEAVAEAEAAVREASRAVEFWEADVAPIAGAFQDTKQPGALVMVVASGYILAGEVLGSRPTGAQARADALLTALTAGGRKTGLLPPRVLVRDQALADALRPELARRGMEVEAAPLPGVDEALDDALDHLAGSGYGRVSMPWTWAEVEAEPAALAELHSAAAEFFREAPWESLDGDDAMLIRFPGEQPQWGATVMGGAGVHVGLALYSDPADLEALVDAGLGDPSESVRTMRAISVALSFSRAPEISRAMRREVAAAGWELASPAAYPVLMGMSIPGRRISEEHVRRISAACRAVTELARQSEIEVPWTSQSTGIEVDFLYDEDDGEDEAGELPWPVLAESHLVAAAGPAAVSLAEPSAAAAAAIMEAEEARLGRFEEWLEAQKLSRAARERMLKTAVHWTKLVVALPMPAEAATEMDLRVFLYRYMPGIVRPAKPLAKHLVASLGRLFTFYREREGFWYPWAEDVLRELSDLSDDSGEVLTLLEELSPLVLADLDRRALLPAEDVPGTLAGWRLLTSELMGDLRLELWRRWVVWHDDVVRGGITVPDAVRDVLVGRQRQWENTPHAQLGGRTPREALLEAELALAEEAGSR